MSDNNDITQNEGKYKNNTITYLVQQYITSTWNFDYKICNIQVILKVKNNGMNGKYAFGYFFNRICLYLTEWNYLHL